MAKFKIPMQSEVQAYMMERKGWPESFCTYYAEKFWNYYHQSGWQLGKGKSVKDWKACFNSQWQNLKYKEDMDKLREALAKPVIVNDDISEYVVTLDGLLTRYISRSTEVLFEEFGKYYQLMKDNRLLKKFSMQEVEELRSIYSNDNFKCRCACVQITLNQYANSGWTFAQTVEARKRLEV